MRVIANLSIKFNPLHSKGNYSATSNNTKSVHWPLVQRGGAWAGCGPTSPFLAVPNVTAHPSTASVPITVLLYDGPLLCVTQENILPNFSLLLGRRNGQTDVQTYLQHA